MNYEQVPLDHIATLLSGGTPSKSNPQYWGGDIPWLTPKDMAQWTGKTENAVTAEAIGNGTRLAPPHACFVAVRGMSLHTEIRIVRSDAALTFNQDIKAIVASKGVDPTFLYYALTAQRRQLLEWVSAAGHGTGVLATDRLRSVPIPSLELPDQLALATVLSSIDDKIELNRRMNETLEAMAQAIFRDWFVDFGPVRRKMAGATDPVEIMGRLVADPARAAELAGSQPVAFADDGRPSGWSVRPLSELTTELRRGIGPKYIERDGVLVLNQKCIRNREVSFGPARRHDDGAKSVTGRTLVDGDVLVNSTGVGTLGRVAQIWGLDQRIIVDSHVTVVRASSTDFSSIYLGLALGLREDEIVALGEGSTGQTELSREHLGRMEMVVPNKAILDQFDAICTPLVERIQANRREAATLAETRDYLLPRLMSGEVRVGDVSKEIAA